MSEQQPDMTGEAHLHALVIVVVAGLATFGFVYVDYLPIPVWVLGLAALYFVVFQVSRAWHSTSGH